MYKIIINFIKFNTFYVRIIFKLKLIKFFKYFFNFNNIANKNFNNILFILKYKYNIKITN